MKLKRLDGVMRILWFYFVLLSFVLFFMLFLWMYVMLVMNECSYNLEGFMVVGLFLKWLGFLKEGLVFGDGRLIKFLNFFYNLCREFFFCFNCIENILIVYFYVFFFVYCLNECF